MKTDLYKFKLFKPQLMMYISGAGVGVCTASSGTQAYYNFLWQILQCGCMGWKVKTFSLSWHPSEGQNLSR